MANTPVATAEEAAKITSSTSSSTINTTPGSFARLANLWGDISVSGEGSARAPLTGSQSSEQQPSRFRHRVTKSTGSRTSITSQPVLVRTYTNSSRPSSSAKQQPFTRDTNTTRPMPAKPTAIPSVDSFSFDGILRAIEPEINEAIDGIAEIYARSRLSLADEYGSHLPPQGEINSPRTNRHSGFTIRTVGIERTLTTVTEASSSSERLAGGSKPGSVASGRGKVTAYGSLRSIMSRGRSNSQASSQLERNGRPLSSSWSIAGDEHHPSIIIIKRQDSAPSQISLASAADVAKAVELAPPIPQHENQRSPRLRPTSWFGWRKSWSGAAHSDAATTPSTTGRLDAETSLKGVLQAVAGST